MMAETPFNAMLRVALKRQNLKCIHIRETENPGVLDLIVYKGSWLVAWVELKVADEKVRPSQIDFMRAHPDNSMVVRLQETGDTWSIEVSRYPLEDKRILAQVGGDSTSVEIALNAIPWLSTLCT